MRSLSRLAAVAVCLLAAAPIVQAQGQPKKLAHVLTVHARPEGALDYEAFAKKVMAAADKAGQTHRVLIYQVTSGGPGYTYMVINYTDTWAETESILTTQEILTKALGEVEGTKVLRAGRQAIASTESDVYRLLPDLSTKPRAYDPPPAYLQVIRTWVKPHMAKEWQRVLARYKAASEQVAEAPPAMRRTSVEGDGFVFVTSMPYGKPSERDAWPTFAEVVTKVYGEDEGRALDQRRMDCIERSENFILKYRGDLSRGK